MIPSTQGWCEDYVMLAHPYYLLRDISVGAFVILCLLFLFIFKYLIGIFQSRAILPQYLFG